MEPNKTKKFVILIPIVLAAAIALAVGISVMQKNRPAPTPGVSLSSLLPKDVRMLKLDIRFNDLKGEDFVPETSKLLGKAGDKKPKSHGVNAEKCPEIIGGDTSDTAWWDIRERDPACPATAVWYVKRHPIGFSLYFQDGKKLLSLFQEEGQVKQLFASKFFQGLFYDILHTVREKAEDHNFDGLEGAFLSKLINEAIQAHAELHYDISHGRKGFVFSFVRGECPYASKTLPMIVRFLARSGFTVPGMAEPVLEMKVGLQRLFLTQYEDRVYLSNGLEALLNVIESVPPPKDMPKLPLVFTVRSEAFMENEVLPVIIGQETWEGHLGFGLSAQDFGALQVSSGKFAKHLHPKIFKGVLAGIPHDAFAAVVTSFYIPADMKNEDWKQLAAKGPGETAQSKPEEAGVAILWDLSSEKEFSLSEMGVVIANQTSPNKFSEFEQFFKKTEYTAGCGGGTVFLAASSQNLLSRMKDSCERQSLSILDWERGTKAKEYDSSQLMLFVNPGAGMREIFLAGGAKSDDLGEFEPQWKQDYEAAKKAMRDNGETVFKNLPIILYAGNAESGKAIRLKGLSIRQGGAK